MPRTTKHPQKAVYMPQELIDRWKQSADKNHRSMNAEMIVALEFYLDLKGPNKMNDLRKNSQNIEISQEYKDNLSERDAFLQTCFDEMFNLSMVCTPEELAEFQTEYDLDGCKAFFEDNYNGA